MAKTNRRSFTYVNAGTVVALPKGIKKFGLKVGTKVAGQIKFTITGKRGSYDRQPPDPDHIANHLPLTGTVILDIPNATTGLCGEAVFRGTHNPLGTCGVLSAGNTVRCK
jgi:hypothetical protein